VTAGLNVQATDTRIESLSTPCLLLDVGRMQRKIARLKDHLRALGIALRPHLKTSKSVEEARLLMPDDEIIIFDSTGTTLLDAAGAAAVYEKALALGRGHPFAFWD
jgi:D-serine deaminase-like pyridoxal phosphate-dependent protein